MRAVVSLMRRVLLLLALGGLLAMQAPALTIGAIQGGAAESPYLNRFVTFRGVVVGRYEDQNTRGDVYYTLFVQSLPGESDGNPATSDGMAVFLGREPRRDVELGDVVRVGGKVTEFYGLTEIDDRGLTVTVEDRTSLPAPAPLNPPADNTAAATTLEALEGMRVSLDEAVVAGPTHTGCGFAVVVATASPLPLVRRAGNDPTGQAVPILYPSDLDCAGIPQVATGDRIDGITGALTYNFDQFKIVIDGADELTITPSARPPVPEPPTLWGQQFSVATLNAEDYFDAVRDTADDGEPLPAAEEVAARQAKLAAQIAGPLGCPTLLALQEVEHEALLRALAAALAPACGFAYAVSHRDSPDARGIDTALLSDPRRVRVGNVALRPACSPVPTGLTDASITCPPGEEPLFGRPPLEVEVTIDGQPAVIWVNHFKSKRDGEIDTALARIQQAVTLNGLASERLAVDAGARLIALGDFNDTELSPALTLLTEPAAGGHFANALSAVPPAQRYTYNFGGVGELIDDILLSPALAAEVSAATIVHLNADYPVGLRLDTAPERLPFRASDHDPALVVVGRAPATPTPAPTTTATATSPATIAPPTATAVAPPTPMPTPAPAPAPTAAAPLSPPAARGPGPVAIAAGVATVALGAVVGLLALRRGRR